MTRARLTEQGLTNPGECPTSKERSYLAVPGARVMILDCHCGDIECYQNPPWLIIPNPIHPPHEKGDPIP